MVQHLWKRRHQLPSILDDVWQWENIDVAVATAQRTRAETLAAAAAAPCVCGGEWPAFVEQSFRLNGMQIGRACHEVMTALTAGRSEAVPVIVFAGKSGGEGKSAFFKPLHALSDGFVFNIPSGKEAGNFPLMNLPRAKVAFLDEFRFNHDKLSFATQNLWFDGSAVPIGKPQNILGGPGNILYMGTAPVFITTKLDDLEWLESHAAENPVTQLPWDTDAAMICRRLSVYKFKHRVPKPQRKFQFCGHCFATLLRTQAAAWVAATQP